MAAKKKTSAAKTQSKAKPAAKKAAKKAAKSKPAAKPAKAKAKAKSKPAAKPAKPAAKPAKLAAKPAKPAAKPSKAAAPKASKPAKAAQAAPPAKPSKPVKAAAPKANEPAKAAAPKAEPAAEETPSLIKTVKRAAAKVAQVAASAALKVLDADAGRSAPAFELSDEKGETVSSESLAGKPYLLYFYPKDDTPGCTKEACDIRDNFGRFGQQGLRVLGVSPDSEASHAKFGKKYGLPFTLLSDPENALATAYGVWGEKNNYGKTYMGIIRSSFLVGADGTIKKAYRGVKVDGHVDAVLEDAKTFL